MDSRVGFLKGAKVNMVRGECTSNVWLVNIHCSLTCSDLTVFLALIQCENLRRDVQCDIVI